MEEERINRRRRKWQRRAERWNITVLFPDVIASNQPRLWMFHLPDFNQHRVLTDDSTGSPVFPMMHNSTWQLKCLFTMTLNDWIIQPVMTFLCECGSVAWQRMSRWFSLPLMYFFPFSAVDIFPADSVMSAAIRSFFTITLKLAAPLTADKDALNQKYMQYMTG